MFAGYSVRRRPAYVLDRPRDLRNWAESLEPRIMTSATAPNNPHFFGKLIDLDIEHRADYAQMLHVYPNGAKLVLTSADSPDPEGYFMRLIRLKPDGQLDAAFGNNGVLSIEEKLYKQFFVDQSGYIYSALRKVLNEDYSGGLSSGRVEFDRYTPTGKLDATWGTDGSLMVDAMQFAPGSIESGWASRVVVDQFDQRGIRVMAYSPYQANAAWVWLDASGKIDASRSGAIEQSDWEESLTEAVGAEFSSEGAPLPWTIDWMMSPAGQLLTTAESGSKKLFASVGLDLDLSKVEWNELDVLPKLPRYEVNDRGSMDDTGRREAEQWFAYFYPDGSWTYFDYPTLDRYNADGTRDDRFISAVNPLKLRKADRSADSAFWGADVPWPGDTWLRGDMALPGPNGQALFKTITRSTGSAEPIALTSVAFALDGSVWLDKKIIPAADPDSAWPGRRGDVPSTIRRLDGSIAGVLFFPGAKPQIYSFDTNSPLMQREGVEERFVEPVEPSIPVEIIPVVEAEEPESDLVPVALPSNLADGREIDRAAGWISDSFAVLADEPDDSLRRLLNAV
jgi:hypothetical protein